MHKRTSHVFFGQLLSLHMPTGDFAIAGSGPLYIRGLIDELGDLDVIARRDAWDIATAHGEPVRVDYSTAQVVRLFGGHIEILDAWFPEVWPVDELIDNADVFEGLRFVALDVVRKTKEAIHRPKGYCALTNNRCVLVRLRAIRRAR